MPQRPPEDAEARIEESADKTKDRPATGSDAYKAVRLEKNLLKHKDEYSSRLFTSLAPETQKYFLAKAQLKETELPVFAFYEDQETWMLATTRRVFWSRPGFNHHLKYGQIKEIGQSEFRKLEQEPEGTESIEERSERIRQIKSNSPWLYFIHDNDNFSEIIVPPGEPLFAIWNSLRFMIQLDRIHPVQ
jgi:hypothetical protein